MSRSTAIEVLAAGTTLEDAFALFDSLGAVTEDELLGDWVGGLVPTGHPGEAMLDRLRWAGKTFRGRDDVDPIVVLDDAGQRTASDVMGAATVRMVEFRGVVTATMVYDKHPVFDHFRRLADDALLGVMDRKGEDHPLVFTLTRSAAPA
jgi:hypothetical protein